MKWTKGNNAPISSYNRERTFLRKHVRTIHFFIALADSSGLIIKGEPRKLVSSSSNSRTVLSKTSGACTDDGQRTCIRWKREDEAGEIDNGKKSAHCVNSQIMKAGSATPRESYARANSRARACNAREWEKRKGRREEKSRTKNSGLSRRVIRRRK